jgi:hypothetical protein
MTAEKTNKSVHSKSKTKVFYGIWTTDDEMHGSIKAYCRTKEIAKSVIGRELNSLPIF